MGKKKDKEEERLRIEVRVDCDTERLYSENIDDAIQYLQEMKAKYAGYKISLDEHWTGYEDMQMTFVFWRDENDEEYNRRMEMKRAREEREREEEERKRNETRARKLAQIAKLQEDLKKL
jgi:pyridoxine/pyridoxamine 5'-phosphate oxidase